jgi:hypothetical protein
MAIISGTVYMFLGAMPIVFGQSRGWSESISALPFLGILVGILVGILAGLMYAIFDNNTRYTRLSAANTATAEWRLPPAIIGAVVPPVGMFAFAWTNYPSIHWAACIILSSPFGFGCVLVILPIVNYLMTRTPSSPLRSSQQQLSSGLSWAPSSPFSHPTCTETLASTGPHLFLPS